MVWLCVEEGYEFFILEYEIFFILNFNKFGLDVIVYIRVFSFFFLSLCS